jgi:hypothetical protein
VLLDAMLADQLEWRNLDLAPALAAEVDDLAPAEVVERWIGAIDEAPGHHSPGVECGEFGSSFTRRHLASRRAATTSSAMIAGRYLCRGPRCKRSARLIAQGLLIHGRVNPNQAGDLEGMDELAEKWGVSAWKCYTQWGPDGHGFFLHEDIGLKMIEKASALGVGLPGQGGG